MPFFVCLLQGQDLYTSFSNFFVLYINYFLSYIYKLVKTFAYFFISTYFSYYIFFLWIPTLNLLECICLNKYLKLFLFFNSLNLWLNYNLTVKLFKLFWRWRISPFYYFSKISRYFSHLSFINHQNDIVTETSYFSCF